MKPSIRGAIADFFKTLAQTKLVLVVVISAALYEVVGVIVIWRFGYWHVSMTKIAVLWYFGTAIAALGNLKGKTTRYLRTVVISSITVAAIVEFISTLYTFPLPVELLLVPLMFLLVALNVVADYHTKTPGSAQVKSCLSFSIGFLGISILIFSIVRTVQSYSDTLTVETLEEFLLPLALAIWFIPFLYFNRTFAVLHDALIMVRFKLGDNKQLYRYAKKAVLRRCLLSASRAELFAGSFQYRFWPGLDRNGVDEIIREFDVALHGTRT